MHPVVSEAVDRYLDTCGAADTPVVVVDLAVVAARYRSLAEALPGVRLYYAVKANPHPKILSRLVDEGAWFDVASVGEIRACVDAGADPSRMSFGNTIKKRAAVEFAASLGVSQFAVDAVAELDKVIELAPGSTVALRMLCDPPGASWPLSRKFGCEPSLIVALARRASRAGCRVGLSFHVGSQQHRPSAWDDGLAPAVEVLDELASEGVTVEMLNLGGGFPGAYGDGAPEIATYGATILAAIAERLAGRPSVELQAEPGRFLVADAGVIRSSVVLVSRKSDDDPLRWVYLDVGVFSGLVETLDESIRYPLRVPGASGPVGPAVLAGPTCDSIDVMAQRVPYDLPLDLAEGDVVDLLSAGAYTTTYSTVAFNGFAPLREVVVGAG